MATPPAPDELGFEPDPTDPQPIYLQLTAALAEAIRSGRLVVGTQLPSERLYAQRLGLSRTTVTAAYGELKAAGLVRGYVGRGAVVIADDPDRAFDDAIAWPQLASRLARPTHPNVLTAEPGRVAFGDGWLHPSLTPRAALAACAGSALDDPELLTKAAPILGLGTLREALLEMLRANGVVAAHGELLVTGGAQQGLNVVARALLSPGDVVVCESPTWHGAFRAFRAAGAEVAGVAMDREGVDPDALEAALIRLRPAFVYLIPTFQCPTGRLLGLERRRRILELCARFRTPIVESHVYGDIAFGETPPSLKSLDEAGIVIHQGSASKTVSPALRLGWLVAPRAAMELLAPAKASLDLSTPALTQAVLATFLRGGGYARHLPPFRAALETRRDALLAALALHCPELRWLTPQGGLYLWAQLPQLSHAAEVEAAAAEAGVWVRGGEAFMPDGGTSSHIRLCYASPALDEIATGAQRLGQALRSVLHRHRDSAARATAFASV
jgi:DNA-binding transcriptional MocR family regulator